MEKKIKNKSREEFFGLLKMGNLIQMVFDLKILQNIYK
jgi:hypothetical protein